MSTETKFEPELAKIASVLFTGYPIADRAIGDTKTSTYHDWMRRNSLKLLKLSDEELAAKAQLDPDAMMALGDELLKSIEWYEDGRKVMEAMLARTVVVMARCAASQAGESSEKRKELN
ncbi:MAG: hypothetical protein Q8L53_10490 [Aestuariivirga sp.]|nr:hypothetical protein [Aestuariivirga sp.]